MGGTVELTPREVYVVLGEMVRRAAGWNLRKNVRGGFEAWVVGDELGDRIMVLPWRRGWDKVRQMETLSVPPVVECVEFPTGRRTGTLTMTGERDGLPVFAWSDVVPGEVVLWEPGPVETVTIGGDG